MKKELDEKLVAKYPEIFKDRYGNPRETLMCWGFECGDGWYPIIDTLCTLLMSEVNSKKRTLHYMKQLKQLSNENKERIQKLEIEIEQEIKKIPVAVQVKEKFGGLRFYVTGATAITDYQTRYIEFAEEMSYHVCEVCGVTENVMLYGIAWHKTLCPLHADERYGKEEAEEFRSKFFPEEFRQQNQ